MTGKPIRVKVSVRRHMTYQKPRGEGAVPGIAFFTLAVACVNMNRRRGVMR